MRDVEKELRDAFQSMTVPEGLNRETLQMIERSRESREDTAKPPAFSGEAFAGDVPEIARASSDPSATEPLPCAVASSSSMRAKVVSRRRSWIARVAAVAACLAVAALGVTGYSAVKTPVAYIDIDVNPSIGLEVNRFNEVVGVLAHNEDGRVVLEDVDVVGMSCEQALETLTESESLSRYVDADSYLEISVSGEDADQVSELLAWGDASLKNLTCPGACRAVASEDREEAHARHMGMGRYQAAKVLSESDPSVEIEDCAEMSMRELRDRLADAGIEPYEGCPVEGCDDPACADAPARREQVRDRQGGGDGEGRRASGA